MHDLYRQIQQILESLPADQPEQSLQRLFCEALNWNAPRGLAPLSLEIGAPVSRALTFEPIAQVASLPVFCVRWHEERAPTLTARRAVQRALAPTYAEHLLGYVVCEAGVPTTVAFTWARRRADGKTELRTLPYTLGAPARTTLERLAELHFSLQDKEPTITEATERLNRAFDVESLSRQFYQEIADWFFWATTQVEFPMPPEVHDRNAYIQQSLIRLITRLLFCWFLKAKRLIPDALFDERQLATLLKGDDPLAASQQTRFYKAILQNLFFATLNQEQDKRGFRGRNPAGRDPHHGITHLYRYEALFTDPERFLELVRPIPFLNGGLFECLDEVYRKAEGRPDRRIDGFSDHPKNPLRVPDYLFFGAERTVDLTEAYGERRTAHVRGLIPILRRYNFTVTESTPLDQEVALDPELAGKVFENLLAAYNPETALTARKATGSYYTPREIVEFMVEESLLHALGDALRQAHPNAPDVERRLRQLLDPDDESNPFSPEATETLIDAIDRLKIIDPACGSGAFPMGALHTLVSLLHKLDPRNERWMHKQIERARAIPDPTVREKVIADIENAFQRNELDYGRKLYLIENSIYGVDIQPIAVQIAKMRFFIALVVDQKPDRSQPNSGIRPLPNLEIRFVAADTLKRVYKSHETLQIDNQRISDLKEQIRRVRLQYFTARTPATKAKLRQQDAELRQALAHELAHIGLPNDTANMLAQWDPYDQNASAPFFDPEWMFGVRDGFDIVIGNPPYIQLQKAYDAKRKYADLYINEGYATFDRRGDIYCLFYERGVELLRPNGILAYITSNKWMRAGYGEKLRDYFAKHTNPLLLIDLGPGVFESATVDTNILLLQCAPNQHRLHAFTYTDRAQNLRDAARAHSRPMPPLAKDAWFIGGDAEHRLKEKIERIGKPLREWDVNIYYGIKTGLNEAFIIDTATRQRILDACKDAAERQRTEAIIKPILRGRDIKRYTYEWKGLWVIFIPWHFPLHEDTTIQGASEKAEKEFRRLYPSVYGHLQQYKYQLMTRNKDETGIRYEWYALQRCAATYYAEFEKEKVVYSEIVREPQFHYDTEKFFVEATAFLMTGSQTKYLCALLNSSPVAFFFKRYYAGGGLGEEGYRYKKAFLENLPIPPPVTPENQSLVAQIEALVDQILARKRGNPNADTRDLERAIDDIVYRLYDLTPDEIRLVEGG
jgi:adenine-specific DNA-methyltransferase